MYEVILKQFENPDEVRTLKRANSNWFASAA
jgi:hypothetical protein